MILASVGYHYSNAEIKSLPLGTASKRNFAAEKFFRDIKKLSTEEERLRHLKLFKKLWPDYLPQPFYSSGNQRRIRAYELLAGRERLLPVDGCGSVGRLRILASKPLERSIISFSVLPKVRKFEYDPDAQFHQQIPDWVREDLIKFFVKGPFIAFIERGEKGKNHVNVLHKQGGCKRGARKTLSDDELFKTAAYFGKKPLWNDENALAYLRSASINKSVARRVIRHGLGDSRTQKITVSEIEEIVGMSLLKRC
jgi:hypothetical protein